jgi:hypothetical protein
MVALPDRPGRGGTKGETDMIDWRDDVDAALAEARATERPLLLDFTAAPA